MLSEGKMTEIFDRAPTLSPVTVRLRFCKVGSLQYISHLDLQRTFARILTRAKIPVWFTQGFNPHPKLVFGMPLSVGTESECELLDIRVDREITPDEIRDQLNACLTDEMQISEAYLPETKLSDIAFARYEVTLSCPVPEGFCEDAKAYLTTSPLTVIKKGKAGEYEEDVARLFRALTVTEKEKEKENGKIVFDMLVKAGVGALNPETAVQLLAEKFGILGGGGECPVEESYRIVRREVYGENGTTPFR